MPITVKDVDFLTYLSLVLYIINCRAAIYSEILVWLLSSPETRLIYLYIRIKCMLPGNFCETLLLSIWQVFGDSYMEVATEFKK